MCQRIHSFSIVCVLVVALAVFSLAMPAIQSDAPGTRRAELNALLLAAKLLERQLNQTVRDLEFLSKQYAPLNNQGSEQGVLSGPESDFVTDEFIQEILWVNNEGGVFRTYPSSVLSDKTRFVGTAVFRLMKRSVRERTTVVSSIMSFEDGSRGLWVAFPVVKDGSHTYSVVGAINLNVIGRMVAPSLRQKVFVLDEEGQFSLSSETLPDFAGWDINIVLGGGATSDISSLADFVSTSIPGVLELTEPSQGGQRETRAMQMVAAPFTFIGRDYALCSLHPIPERSEQTTKKEVSIALPLVLSIVAAAIFFLGLGYLARRLRRTASIDAASVAPQRGVGQDEITGEKARSGFVVSEALLAALPIPAFVGDARGHLVTANAAFCDLLEARSIGHLAGRRLDAVFGEQNRDRTNAFIEAVSAAGSARADILFRSKQDEIIEVQVDGVTVDSNGEERILVMCANKAQTSRAPSGGEQTAVAEDSYLKAVLDGLSEAVMIVGSDYCVRRANTNLLKLVGAASEDDVLGRCCYEVYHGRDKPCSSQKTSCPVREVLAKDRPMTMVHQQRCEDGSRLHLEVFACPIKGLGSEAEVLVSLKDITEKTQLSMQLARADKLKALGEMASGVAHDFNNLLGVILGRTQMLIRMIGGSDAGAKRNLEIIERTALDGAETVRRIQGFAKVSDQSAFVPVDLNGIIEDSIGITKPRWKDQMQVQGVVVQMKFAKSKIPRVAGKPSELRELFVNLINNALDAMPEGGRITLETGTREGNVYALVTDNGQGISPGILDKIFDPFFTTREPTNSGLGLSIVLGIVERHCGTIGVRSEPGDFTEFRVELPSMVDDFRETLRPDAERAEPAPASAKARILIIDDEADIRSLLADMLAGEGHEVDVASSGEEGIRKCKRGGYDHVITDLGMPHMSGWEVARKVKELRPETAVILATGWGMHFDEEQLKAAGISRVITKPFQVEEVLTCFNGRR